MIIAFCGHDSVPDYDKVREWLSCVLDPFLYEDELIFYLGGYGEFDRIAASVVWQKKQQNSNAKSVLVLPYINRKYNTELHDYTVFPPIESVPPRYAISKRNEWMVFKADVVIAYVTHGWGGASETLEYARRKKKRIIVYPKIE